MRRKKERSKQHVHVKLLYIHAYTHTEDKLNTLHSKIHTYKCVSTCIYVICRSRYNYTSFIASIMMGAIIGTRMLDRMRRALALIS